MVPGKGSYGDPFGCVNSWASLSPVDESGRQGRFWSGKEAIPRAEAVLSGGIASFEGQGTSTTTGHFESVCHYH